MFWPEHRRSLETIPTSPDYKLIKEYQPLESLGYRSYSFKTLDLDPEVYGKYGHEKTHFTRYQRLKRLLRKTLTGKEPTNPYYFEFKQQLIKVVHEDFETVAKVSEYIPPEAENLKDGEGITLIAVNGGDSGSDGTGVVPAIALLREIDRLRAQGQDIPPVKRILLLPNIPGCARTHKDITRHGHLAAGGEVQLALLAALKVTGKTWMMGYSAGGLQSAETLGYAKWLQQENQSTNIGQKADMWPPLYLQQMHELRTAAARMDLSLIMIDPAGHAPVDPKQQLIGASAGEVLRRWHGHKDSPLRKRLKASLHGPMFTWASFDKHAHIVPQNLIREFMVPGAKTKDIRKKYKELKVAGGLIQEPLTHVTSPLFRCPELFEDAEVTVLEMTDAGVVGNPVQNIRKQLVRENHLQADLITVEVKGASHGDYIGPIYNTHVKDAVIEFNDSQGRQLRTPHLPASEEINKKETNYNPIARAIAQTLLIRAAKSQKA